MTKQNWRTSSSGSIFIYRFLGAILVSQFHSYSITSDAVNHHSSEEVDQQLQQQMVGKTKRRGIVKTLAAMTSSNVVREKS